MKKIRKEICRQCVGSNEQPHYISGIGTACEECKVYQAWGEFEKIKGEWKPFATFRGYN